MPALKAYSIYYNTVSLTWLSPNVAALSITNDGAQRAAVPFTRRLPAFYAAIPLTPLRIEMVVNK